MLCEDYITNLADCEDRPWSGVVGLVKHVEWVVFGLGDGIAERCSFNFFGEERYVVVETEDGACEEERLGDVHQDTVRDIIFGDDLVEGNGYAGDNKTAGH